MNKTLFTGICLTFLFLGTSVLAEPIQLGPVYTDRPDEVSLAVSLPPGPSKPPEPNDFQLLDGERIIASADTIEPFAVSDRKIALLICIDVSRSINKSILKESQDALINIFAEPLAKPGYRYALASFADKVDFNLDFTEDVNVVKKSIRELKISQGKKTLLYQALIDALNKFNSLNSDDFKRILLIISDGKDEGSAVTLEQVVDLSKELEVPIDAIGRGIIPRQYADGLRGLAKATGGHFIYPEVDLSIVKKELRLKKAIIQLIKSVIDNTWIVHFKYKTNAEKTTLVNAVLQLKGSDSVRISRGLPMPQENIGINEPMKDSNPVDAHPQIDWKHIVKYLPYLGFVLLLIATLIFIAWVLGHRKTQPNNESIPERKEPLIPNTDHLETQYKPESPKIKENQRRLTEVGSTVKPHLLNPNRTGLFLVATEGSLAGHKIAIEKQQFQIGANANNDLVIDDNYVSGNHALLRFENGELFLSDLNSRNGTFLNEELVKNNPIAIAQGDMIRIGNSTFRVTEA
jgi:hypothetical protein